MRLTVGLVFLCQAFNMLTTGAIALFLPLMREDLRMSFAEAGLLSAAATSSYALLQIPAGYLADRYGPRRVYFVGVLGTALVSLLLGATHSYPGAIANQLVVGAFRALQFAPGLTLMARWFPPNRRATAMSVYMVGGVCGSVLLSVAGPVLAVRYGWRVPFVAFAALGVLGGLAYYGLGKDRGASAVAKPLGLAEIGALFRYPIMWVCAALQFIRFGVATSFNFWLPSLLVADRGFSLQTAGLVSALGFAAMAVGNATGGYLSDRLRNPPLVIGASLAALACTGVLLVTVESGSAVVLVVAANAFFLQLYFGPLFHLPVETLGARLAGTATGFGNMFANLGALVFAVSLGLVKDRAGSFTSGFVAISGFCLAGVALAVLLARMRRAQLALRGA